MVDVNVEGELKENVVFFDFDLKRFVNFTPKVFIFFSYSLYSSNV